MPLELPRLVPGKTVSHLLRHVASGDHIAIGMSHGAFRIWSRYAVPERVPEQLLADVVALVATLWDGERWGATPATRNAN